MGNRVQGRSGVVDAPAFVEFASLGEGLDHRSERRVPEPHPVSPRRTEGLVLVLGCLEHLSNREHLGPEGGVESHGRLEQRRPVGGGVHLGERLAEVEGVVHVLDERDQQAGPVTEVQVDGLARDRRPVRHLGELELGTLLGDQFPGGVEDAVPVAGSPYELWLTSRKPRT